MLAAFFASLVEFIEALTIVLAIGAVRGWRGALAERRLLSSSFCYWSSCSGQPSLKFHKAVFRSVLGTLLLLFGLRWLRKAVLRTVGVVPFYDEAKAYAEESVSVRAKGGFTRGWDRVAVSTVFKITMIEGIEVVFIVVALGAGGHGLLLPACLGALAALVLVVALRVMLHRPVAMIPENTLKFLVRILLCSFGTFWVGEGMAMNWPGGDVSVAALSIGYPGRRISSGAPVPRKGSSGERYERNLMNVLRTI